MKSIISSLILAGSHADSAAIAETLTGLHPSLSFRTDTALRPDTAQKHLANNRYELVIATQGFSEPDFLYALRKDFNRGGAQHWVCIAKENAAEWAEALLSEGTVDSFFCLDDTAFHIRLAADIRRFLRNNTSFLTSQDACNALIESLDAATIIVNEAGIVLTCNERSKNILPGTKALASGKALADQLPPPLQKTIDNLLEIVTAQQKPANGKSMSPDAPFDITVAPSLDDAGKATSFVIFLRNSCENAVFGDYADKLNADMKAVLEASREGVLLTDPEGKWLQFNRRYEELWELSEDLLTVASDKEMTEHAMSLVHDADNYRLRIMDIYSDPLQSSVDLISFRSGRFVERRSFPYWLDNTLVGRVWMFHDITNQHRIKLKNRRMHNLFSSVMDSSRDAIIIYDSNFTVVYANDTAARHFGWDSAEYLLGKTSGELSKLLQLCDEEGRPIATEELPSRRAARGHIVEGQVITIKQPDAAATHWGNVSARQIHLEDAPEPYILISTSNITQIKEIEAQLQRSVQRLKAILASIADAVLVYDPDDRILYANDWVAHYGGLSSVDEVLRMSRAEYAALFLLFDADNNQLTPDDLPGKYAIEKKRSVSAEIRFVRKADGYSIWGQITAVPSFDPDGTLTSVVTTVSNISRQKDARKVEHPARLSQASTGQTDNTALMRRQMDLDLVTRIAHIGYWTWDLETDSVDLSPEMRQLLGLEQSMRNFRREEFRPLVHPDDLEGLSTALEACLSGEEPLNHTFRIYRATVRLCRTLHVGGLVERDEKGNPVRMIGVNRDITRETQLREELTRVRNELEETVAERTAELRDKNQELEAFTYAVSHDLKAPLRQIRAYENLLVQEIDSNSEPAEWLKRIDKVADHMDQLIESLLWLSRAGRTQPQRVPIKLKPLLQESIERRSELIDPSAISLSVDENLQVEADSGLMRVLIDNLVDNAIKYRETSRDLRLTVTSFRDKGRMWISFSDNGIGFNQNNVDEVFKPFKRLSFSSKATGFGIGLATVARIVNCHGGEIRAEGSPGKGATFSFTLEEQ